jgi:glycerol-3-phosphate dehydrogenase
VRADSLERLRQGAVWDLVIIGGGATGLGAAVDAAARGYRVALVEAHDYAKGTSSRSTKLIHGGVRYLEQGRIGLVHEALHEREVLLANAPHLVHLREFLVPAYHRWDRPFYGAGLALYDLLAGRRAMGRSRIVDRDEAFSLAPTLRRDGLRGGVVYRDGQFDDSRLAIALLRTFEGHGGVALNYAPVTALLRQGRRVAGVEIRDRETDEALLIRARGVLNATGVFADVIRRLDDPTAKPLVRPSRGAHLVFDRRFLPGAAGVLVPRTDDGRVAFAIPWNGRTLFGTTDVAAGSAPIEPHVSPVEVDYLLDHAARYLDPAPGRTDIRSAFAGLRPLLGAEEGEVTSRLSREHLVIVSDTGLVTITGGKWTTYRRMAADAVDRAAETAGLEPRACATESLRLHGWAEPDDSAGPLAAYGSDAAAIRAWIAERPDLGEPLHPRLPYNQAEVVWAARHESARTVEDVLARRTRALFLDAPAAREAAPTVARRLAAELGRDEAWERRQVVLFDDLAQAYSLA